MFLTESEVTPQGILDALGGEEWLKLMLGEGTEIGELCPEEELEFKRGLYIISRTSIDDYLMGYGPYMRLFFLPAYRGDVNAFNYTGKAFYMRTYHHSYEQGLDGNSRYNKSLFLNGSPISQTFTSNLEALIEIVERTFKKTLTFS